MSRCTDKFHPATRAKDFCGSQELDLLIVIVRKISLVIVLNYCFKNVLPQKL